MTVTTITMRTFPLGLMTQAFTPPPTQAAAKQLARDLNAEARREREQQEVEHRTRQRELAAVTERTRAQGPAPAARARGARIDTSAVYAERNRPQEDSERKTATASPMSTRARTFADLARHIYGPSPVEADGLIPTTGRGGR